jgi:hypothetical protein
MLVRARWDTKKHICTFFNFVKYEPPYFCSNSTQRSKPILRFIMFRRVATVCLKTIGKIICSPILCSHSAQRKKLILRFCMFRRQLNFKKKNWEFLTLCIDSVAASHYYDGIRRCIFSLSIHTGDAVPSLHLLTTQCLKWTWKKPTV